MSAAWTIGYRVPSRLAANPRLEAQQSASSIVGPGIHKKAAIRPLLHNLNPSEEKQDPEETQHQRKRAVNDPHDRLHRAEPTEKGIDLKRNNNAECSKEPSI